MMHHEIFHPSWGNFNDIVTDSTYYHDQDFLFSVDNSLEIFSNPISYNSELSHDYFPMISEEFDTNLSFEFDGLFEESSDGFWSPSSQLSSKSDYSSVDVTSKQQEILILPSDEETKNIIDNELRLSHLLMAYSEAIEKGNRELSRVILKRVNDRSNPIGKTLERIAFELSKEFENESDNYLMKESMKSFDSAFDAFYRIFPYGKFAHFTANSAILDAAPDSEFTTVHLVDFDLGEGLQWPQMIEEAAKRRFKRLKLTSIRWELEEDQEISSFDETRRKLVDLARSCGLDLKMEEIGIDDLVNHLKKSMKNNGVREFLAFNCVVGIPHMRRLRNRSNVIEFVRLAKDFILGSSNNYYSFRGILVLADGDPFERLAQNCFTFGQFFEGHLGHYKAILESMESGFPSHLAEARVGMECLFVAPFVHSGTWLGKWAQLREGRGLVGPGVVGLEGLRLSGESVMEGNEIVKGEGCYGVRVGGVNGNEVGLEWNEIPLVKVSAWISQS